MTNLERRYSSYGLELRADDTGNRIAGYAAKFGKRSKDLGGFIEFVGNNAFSDSLNSGANILCRFEHENVGLLGTTDAGTLSVWTDETGLAYDCLPPVNSPVTELVKRGDVTKSSFAFRTVADEWTRGAGGMPTRTLHLVELVDVAPVTVPAYDDTDVRGGVVESLSKKFDVDPEEIRNLLDSKQVVKLFKQTRKTSVTKTPVDEAAKRRYQEFMMKRFNPLMEAACEDDNAPSAWGTESWHKNVNTHIAQVAEDNAKREAQLKDSQRWTPENPTWMDN